MQKIQTRILNFQPQTKKKNKLKKTILRKAPTETLVRLNKRLADLGVASRRRADQLILAGRVKINGKVVKELGTKVSIKEKNIEVDGQKTLSHSQNKHYYLFYKPHKVVTTMSDPENRPCVGEYFKDAPVRLYPVGRLDFDSEGLLLMTNDGDIALKLSHPKFEKKKVYWVKVKGRPTLEATRKLKKGIHLDEGLARAQFIESKKQTHLNSWFTMTLKEGKNRQIRRMWEILGHGVLKLIRVQFGPLHLGTLRPGEVRKLTPQEVEILKKS